MNYHFTDNISLSQYNKGGFLKRIQHVLYKMNLTCIFLTQITGYWIKSNLVPLLSCNCPLSSMASYTSLYFYLEFYSIQI